MGLNVTAVGDVSGAAAPGWTDGQRLRALRTTTGLSWTQLAALFGVSRRQIQLWASDVVLMTATQVARLDVLYDRVTTARGTPAEVRAWLCTRPSPHELSRFAAWVAEVCSFVPDDGRTLDDQLANTAKQHRVELEFGGARPVDVDAQAYITARRPRFVSR